MPPTNFEAFMYTASRALACEKKGSFSDARTTSPHMLEYFRYDMPAMRQYACEVRRIFFLVSGESFGGTCTGNGVRKTQEPRRARWCPGGIDDSRRSRVRRDDSGEDQGWIGAA